ncbi:MAG: GTPase HflX, partial [Phascolarctobacterium sp.]|nr:GTPase HflX [Phascolarctobacterium sp.]
MSEILGNLKGIRNSVIEELKTLYDMKLTSGQLLSAELALKLADITDFINREISVYITRSGQIIKVVVGSNETVELPAVEGRRGSSRLSGIRCVHTHPSGAPALSGVDISALKSNRFDCMVAIGVTSPYYAESTLGFGMIVGIDENEQFIVENYGPLTMADAENIYFPNLVNTVERILDKQTSSTSLAQAQERAVLVGMEYNGMLNTLGWTIEDSVEELKQLADTAGAQVVARFLQKRPKP